MKYEENQGYGKERGMKGEWGYCTLYLKTQKQPKYENKIWTIERDTKKREKS